MAYGMVGQGIEGAGRGFPQTPMRLPKSVVRVGQQSLWSSQAYNNASVLANTQDRIFVTPRGQGGQGFANMTLAETNLKESGRVPGGYAYDVFAMSCFGYTVSTAAPPVAPIPITVADLGNLIKNAVLSWDFLQSQIEIATVHLIGAGGGLFGLGSGAAAPTVTNSNNSVWLYNQHPVMLPSNATFGILINWGQFSHIPTTANAEFLIVKVNLLGRFQTAIAVG